MLVGERSWRRSSRPLAIHWSGDACVTSWSIACWSRGMGAVYLGEDTSLGRPVAIKVLDQELGRDPDVVARFEREARAQARLAHPNVAQDPLHRRTGHLHFFAMEYLEARRSIRSWPWRTGPVGQGARARARGVARPAAAAGRRVRSSRRQAVEPDARSGQRHQIARLRAGQEHARRCRADRNGPSSAHRSTWRPNRGERSTWISRGHLLVGCALYHMLTAATLSRSFAFGIITMHVTGSPIA